MAAQMKQTQKLYVRLYALEGSTRQSRASNAGLADRRLCVHPGTVSLGPVLHSAFPEHAGERSTALQDVGGRAS